jgi:hypothetical protein
MHRAVGEQDVAPARVEAVRLPVVGAVEGARPRTADPSALAPAITTGLALLAQGPPKENTTKP